MKLDCLFIHPGASNIIYQELSDKFAAIEPPTWSLLLASACRAKNYNVAIIDSNALRLSDEETAKQAIEHKPKIICFPVYGQNPNSGTSMMTGVRSLANKIKESGCDAKIVVIGSHASALPHEVLSHSEIDFVFVGDGVYGLLNLLATDLSDLAAVRGLGWKDDQGSLRFNAAERTVPQELMDTDLPGYAWDLLPFKNKPLDLYRSCNWHTNFIESKRTPYASIYTSLGCRFKCSFCMINQINRTSFTDKLTSADNSGMRFWSPELMFNEFKNLYELGVKTIRISDEMFFLDKRYFEPLLNKLVESGIGQELCLWSYARVDTVRSKFLDLFKKAGMNYLALGIEAADTTIRKEVTKGSYQEVDIRDIVKEINDSGINVISNYIFGLPDDTMDSMNQTLDMALELNTEMANFYAAAALPGSPLYYDAVKNGWELPKTYDAWSFHSYESLPLPTKYLTAAQVLKFRDSAWNMYFTNPAYISMINKKFGEEAANHIKNMTKIKLKRKLLGD